MNIKIDNITPGEILLEEFLKPMNISMYKLAKETGIAQIRVSEIVNNKRKITANTAIRFSKFFGNSPDFWLGIQNGYNLEEENINNSNIFKGIHKYVAIELSNTKISIRTNHSTNTIQPMSVNNRGVGVHSNKTTINVTKKNRSKHSLTK